jgi:toxin ParE1/3/4
MVQVNWLKSARDDLKDIYEYISLDSKRYARLQIEKIQKSVELLKNSPEIGRKIPEFFELDIREIIEGNYRIIYRILDGNTIDILLVHHSARDLSSRIK